MRISLLITQTFTNNSLSILTIPSLTHSQTRFQKWHFNQSDTKTKECVVCLLCVFQFILPPTLYPNISHPLSFLKFLTCANQSVALMMKIPPIFNWTYFVFCYFMVSGSATKVVALHAENNLRGSITVWLTSGLFSLDSATLLMLNYSTV